MLAITALTAVNTFNGGFITASMSTPRSVASTMRRTVTSNGPTAPV